MVCCSAINCSNSSTKGYRLFRFPVENRRRAIWVKKCGRGGNWSPGLGSRLCEVSAKSFFCLNSASSSRKLANLFSE